MNAEYLKNAETIKKYLRYLGKEVPSDIQSIIDNGGNLDLGIQQKLQSEPNTYGQNTIKEQPAVPRFSDNLEFNEFNSGGTHESNPMGGIPQGLGSNGKINTVEQGETSVSTDDGKFVFSDRIDTLGNILEPLPNKVFAKGGNIKNCGGPGQPPCTPLDMEDH